MDNFIIEENDLEYAQSLCSEISDSEVRHRAIANALGAKIASKFFNTDLYDVDIETALQSLPIINTKFDISDIYINGNYVDVRVYISDDELCVPKYQLEYGVIPVSYMFIKIAKNLSESTITGFLLPQNIAQTNELDGYYYVNESELVSLSDVESRLKNSTYEEKIENTVIYDFIENNLNEEGILNLLKILVSSKEARLKFIKTIKAQSILNLVSKYDLQIEDKENLDKLFSSENTSLNVQSFTDNLSDKFEYTTEVTPSCSEIMEEVEETEENENAENVGNEESEESANAENVGSDENEDQIDALFTGEQQEIPVNKNHSVKFLIVLSLLFALCGAGCWWFANANKQDDSNLENASESVTTPNEVGEIAPIGQQKNTDSMPNENVNAVAGNNAQNNEQGNSVSIPAIEQNLDASVLVSNLKVDWEVPAGYVSNTSAKRYLVKLGKIIQLNLKTELLLLSKPPISNRITVELKFNQNLNKFEVVGIQTSSGEKTVDDTILQAVATALKMNISSNLESFSNLQGNPILIIHL